MWASAESIVHKYLYLFQKKKKQSFYQITLQSRIQDPVKIADPLGGFAKNNLATWSLLATQWGEFSNFN